MKQFWIHAKFLQQFFKLAFCDVNLSSYNILFTTHQTSISARPYKYILFLSDEAMSRLLNPGHKLLQLEFFIRHYGLGILIHKMKLWVYIPRNSFVFLTKNIKLPYQRQIF